MRTAKLVPEELRTEIEGRVRKVQKRMEREGLDTVLVASNANIFYLSGRFFRGYIYIPREGYALYLPIKPVGLEGENVVYIRKPELIPDVLGARGFAMPGRIGMELNAMVYSDVERLLKVFPESELRNCSGLISECRMVKSDYELGQMRIDADHQVAAYRRFHSVFQIGMTDIEFQIEIERILRSEGALGFYRTSGNLMELNMGTVLNGDNADAPTPYEFAVGGGGVDLTLPAGADGRIMHRGTTVSADMNGSFNGYQTDMTRTWRIGEVPEIACKAHECSRRILRTLEKMAVPGVVCDALYHEAMRIVEEEGLQAYFMGHTQKAAFIGHGVGIELNEPPVVTPRSKQVLERNMTIALEPKLVLPKIGPVGVENTYVITDRGAVALTVFPEELNDLDN